MALWGRRDAVALTGNVSIASGNTTLSGLTGATFLTELAAGTFIAVAGQEFKIASITNANTAVVVSPAGSAITNQAAVINDKPKFVDPRNSSWANTVINVSVAEAANTANNAIGIKTPGWNRVLTAGGRTRVECLVAMKDPN